jgi:NDP-4-keto-2,6-dideoxyhexose 3-C-methyltransferase
MTNTIPEVTVRTTCRVCGSPDLVPLFSLGEQYVSNFVKEEDVHNGIKCPINLQLCTTCTLVQLEHTAPQELLYTRQYWYKSGTTDIMRAGLHDVTKAAKRVAGLKAGDVVLDIGSNDGTLLRSYEVPGLIRIGVEPAVNFAGEGAEGINVLVNDFWSAEAYASHPKTPMAKPKVITACGMLYDLEDPNQFVADVSRILRKDGVFIAQLMCLVDMLDTNDVGNFAHEHLEFYSLACLEYLCDQHGLQIFDIESNNINGRSTRLYIQHRGGPYQRSGVAKANIESRLRREVRLEDPSFYEEFFAELEANKKVCVDFINQEFEKGKHIWVYGASTKGNTILQYYGLKSPIIDGAAERSVSKWGLVTVGTGIPIHSEHTARLVKPEYFLVLPYAFIDEFVQRERDWLAGGGKFIVPLPKPYLVSLVNGTVEKIWLDSRELL